MPIIRYSYISPHGLYVIAQKKRPSPEGVGPQCGGSRLSRKLFRRQYFPVVRWNRRARRHPAVGSVWARLRFDRSQIGPGLALLKTLVIISWLRFFLRSAESVIETMGRSRRHFNFAQKDTVPLLKNMVIVFLFLAGVYSILISWDINVTGLVASAGIVGLALSFAAQDTLSHLFAGVAILADRPYRIGDFIVLDTGERGKVTHIGLRSTRLMTRDDVEVSIPNGVMGSAKIVNESGGGVKRFRITASVGVAYGSDVEKVLQILTGVGIATPNVVEDPEPRARFRAFGASSLDFDLLVWISDPEQRGLRLHEINCAINRRFQEEGIVIPFPQQDVWIKQLPSDKPYDNLPG